MGSNSALLMGELSSAEIIVMCYQRRWHVFIDWGNPTMLR